MPVDFTQSGIESSLIAIWTELLGIENIKAGDNFFDLGGDSLLALQVASRLRENLIADISVAIVLEAPTVADLAQRVLEQHRATSNNDRVTEMLKRIKDISPEEKARLLAEARKKQGARG